jgi:hypothetical protein
MSGAKIVRIVTRDEVIATCRGLLAQLDDAIETWRRTGERRDLIDQQDITRVLSRRDQISKLLERGRFPDLQKQVPQEIMFLQTDIERRLDKKAAVERDNRTGRRRLANAAASLLASLESVRVELHPDLRRAHQRC